MLGQAAVAIWCDVAAAARREFEDWHAHEHMPERLSIPGFLRGSRWTAGDDRDAQFMLYEARDEATVTSGAYLERLNDPTPWSRKMMPEHRNMVRSACRVRRSFGSGLGGALLTVRFSPQPAADAGLESWLAAEALPGLPSRKGLLAAHLLRNVASPSTVEQRIRGGDAAADWIVLVAGYDAEAVASVAARELGPSALAARGAAPGAIGRVYGLACLMSAGDARREAS
jgi:hypothetical protein